MTSNSRLRSENLPTRYRKVHITVIVRCLSEQIEDSSKKKGGGKSIITIYDKNWTTLHYFYRQSLSQEWWLVHSNYILISDSNVWWWSSSLSSSSSLGLRITTIITYSTYSPILSSCTTLNFLQLSMTLEKTGVTRTGRLRTRYKVSLDFGL